MLWRKYETNERNIILHPWVVRYANSHPVSSCPTAVGHDKTGIYSNHDFSRFSQHRVYDIKHWVSSLQLRLTFYISSVLFLLQLCSTKQIFGKVLQSFEIKRLEFFTSWRQPAHISSPRIVHPGRGDGTAWLGGSRWDLHCVELVDGPPWVEITKSKSISNVLRLNVVGLGNLWVGNRASTLVQLPDRADFNLPKLF